MNSGFSRRGIYRASKFHLRSSSGEEFTPKSAVTRVILAGAVEMQKITILGDNFVQERPDDPHTGKIKNEDHRIKHRHRETDPAEHVKSAAQCPARFDEIQLAHRLLVSQLRMDGAHPLLFAFRMNSGLLKIDELNRRKKVHHFNELNAVAAELAIPVVDQPALHRRGLII